MSRRIRVSHVISGLGMGGAENVLWNFLSQSDPERMEHTVISLTDDGVYGERMRILGVNVVSINFRKGYAFAPNFIKLVRTLKSFRPDVVQTWLYHGDFLGSIASRIGLPSVPIFWGIHLFNLDPRINPKPIVFLYSMCSLLSWKIPDEIVACSASAAQNHVDVGYSRAKMRIVYNGFNTKQFTPDREDAVSFRNELKIPSEAPVVGIVARFDPQKDHYTFLNAAKLVRKRRPDVRFIMCGPQIIDENQTLKRWIRECGLEGAVSLLGPRSDMNRVYRAFDLATLSSLGEAMPMTIGEAMSSGVPCVATDVGDTRQLIGDTGLVVPPGDPSALATALCELLSKPEAEREKQGLRARERIQNHFSIEAMVSQYETHYRNILNPSPEGKSL